MTCTTRFYTYNGNFVEMTPIACSNLLDFLYPKLEEMDFETAVGLEVGYNCNTWGLRDLPQNPKQYMQAYHWIIEACDTIDSLTPYKDALNKALMADPRFQHKQAA